jgi:signal transduction histidine kinase
MLEKLDRATKQVQRLARLVNELLDVTRIASGQFELTPQQADLGTVVRDVAARFEEDLRQAACPLELIVESAVGSWDPLRLDQVLTNLLHNAIKYGPGKPIRIAVAADEGGARLEVTDHGIGIESQDVARIFGRFERAVSWRSYGGLGLGLFIVDQIVKAHGGTIEVESKIGAGSTFRVRLPYSGGWLRDGAERVLRSAWADPDLAASHRHGV